MILHITITFLLAQIGLVILNFSKQNYKSGLSYNREKARNGTAKLPQRIIVHDYG